MHVLRWGQLCMRRLPVRKRGQNQSEQTKPAGRSAGLVLAEEEGRQAGGVGSLGMQQSSKKDSVQSLNQCHQSDDSRGSQGWACVKSTLCSVIGWEWPAGSMSLVWVWWRIQRVAAGAILRYAPPNAKDLTAPRGCQSSVFCIGVSVWVCVCVRI